MYSQIILTILSFCLAGSQASRPPLCRLPSKPCRLQISIQNRNGTVESELNTQLCSCALPNQCSSDWSQASHVISRNLVSSTNNVTMNMMFCQSVQPQRFCTLGEQALVVSGSLTIPYDVISHDCRCTDSAPLVLSDRSTGRDYLIYHSYICNNHMPTCPRRISQCASLRPEGITYNCKCASGSQCRVAEGANLIGQSVTHLYCRP